MVLQTGRCGGYPRAQKKRSHDLGRCRSLNEWGNLSDFPKRCPSALRDSVTVIVSAIQPRMEEHPFLQLCQWAVTIVMSPHVMSFTLTFAVPHFVIPFSPSLPLSFFPDSPSSQ